jgi:hypothetical protein
MNRSLIPLILFFLFCRALTSQGQKAFSEEMLRNPKANKNAFAKRLKIVETPTFSPAAKPMEVLLENGYAQHRFKNPDTWPLQGQKVQATEITIIFTKYPKDSAFWLTDYQWLLAKRISALFQLDSSLNSNRIKYSILLQTDCENEFETMQLFHGVQIKYELISSKSDASLIQAKSGSSLDDQADTPNSRGSSEVDRNKSTIKKLMQWMYDEKYSMDSSVFNVLERNQQWNNTLLVIDWTGSMYGYGAEAVLWHVLNEDKSRIAQCAFFNDGDGAKNRKKVLGSTGGIYTTSAMPSASILKTMRKSQRRGSGGDSPENDLEAIIKACAENPALEEIILIADNNSCIRDFILWEQVKKPVHIILCGTKNGVNHQYLNLAWKTGGSIHTKNLDFGNIDQRLQQDLLIVNDIRYTLTANNVILPVDRQLNFFGHCNRFYEEPRVRARR